VELLGQIHHQHPAFPAQYLEDRSLPLFGKHLGLAPPRLHSPVKGVRGHISFILQGFALSTEKFRRVGLRF
jgi:hypothetical protein